jgi:hypothetical protein
VSRVASAAGCSSRSAAQQLADQSLLKVVDTASGTRYRMLETVREVAAAHREDAGETDRVTGRFFAWAQLPRMPRPDFVPSAPSLTSESRMAGGAG